MDAVCNKTQRPPKEMHAEVNENFKHHGKVARTRATLPAESSVAAARMLSRTLFFSNSFWISSNTEKRITHALIAADVLTAAGTEEIRDCFGGEKRRVFTISFLQDL